MAKSKPILIGCPQYGVLTRGWYECDEDGRYRLAPDGTFALQRVRCGHYGGRCMETLCALHRFNRGGPATWFPSEILALDEPTAQRPRRLRAARSSAPSDGCMDLLC